MARHIEDIAGGITRREFSASVLVAALVSGAAACKLIAPSAARRWKKGELQVHFIYTGVGEQIFFVFPDATTMLVDCGEVDTSKREPAPIPPGVLGHAGAAVANYVRRVNPNRDRGLVDYFMLSHYHSDHTRGLEEALKTLRFAKVFDRTYPDLNKPCRLEDYGADEMRFMTYIYELMKRRDGTIVEKWRVGERDQLKLLHGGADGFSIFNLCGNGLVADEKTGKVTNCYETYPDCQPTGKGQKQWINENGLSVGFLLNYGSFRFFCAGDFSDRPYGLNVEDIMADHVNPVTVAKLNHHGYMSMFSKLTAALRPEAWVNCTWNHRQLTNDTMECVTSRSLYPGDRRMFSTFHNPKRPCSDLASPLCSTGAHVVMTVEPGGAWGIEMVDAFA